MSVIEVKDVHKKFKVYYDKGQTLKERLLFKNRAYHEDRWVLNGISFSVDAGETLGLIGENGCGKSTMLKMMTKIMYPDKGEISIKGRVSSLIELGAGFHPDMSGRENIYTNASIFGLTKKEIDRRLDDIISFSELEEFIDNPVRTYSSGMYMRLAFSVAINVDADVLLIDEILAVGDANFQAKCYNHLRKLKSKGVTIVLVTHDTNTIETFCNKAIWINEGKMMMYDKSSKVVDAYINYMNEKRYQQLASQRINVPVSEPESCQEENQSIEVTQNRAVNSNQPEEKQHNEKSSDKVNVIPKEMAITKVVLKNSEGMETLAFRGGESISIEIHYHSLKNSAEYNFGIAIWSPEGNRIFGTTTHDEDLTIEVSQGDGFICFSTDKLQLLSGQYLLHVAVASLKSDFIQYLRDYCTFEVVSSSKSVGLFDMQHKWVIGDDLKGIQKKSNFATIQCNEVQETDLSQSDFNQMLLKAMEDPIIKKNIAMINTNHIRVFGSPDRIKMSKTANMVNTLFNTVSGDIAIGEYVFAGHNVSLITGTHDIHCTGEDRQKAYPTAGNDIIIHDGVWLGSNCMVLGPCRIEKDAVVAAGSVVLPHTHIKPGEVYAGVPAKKVKDISQRKEGTANGRFNYSRSDNEKNRGEL